MLRESRKRPPSAVKKGIRSLVLLLVVTMLASSAGAPLCMGMNVHGAEETSSSSALLAHYEFNDEKNLGRDTSGKGNHAAVFGKVSLTEGVLGGGILFDSTDHGNKDAYIRLPSSLGNQKKLTVAAWVRYDVDTVGNYARIFAVEAGNGQSFHLMANSGSPTSGYKAEFMGGSPGNASIVTEGLVPQTKYNGWHHVAMTYDGTRMILYVDGAYIRSTAVKAQLGGWNISNFFLGKTALWGDGTYNGQMDDVRVYGAALTEKELCAEIDFTVRDGVKGRKLLSSLTLDGKPLSEFNAFGSDYYIILDSANAGIPAVACTAPYEGATVTVKQAEMLPGDAVITVSYADGQKQNVTVSFRYSDVHLTHPEFTDVVIDDAFWNGKLKMFSEVTAPYVLAAWVSNTHDDLRNFDKVAAGHRNTGDYVGSMTWGESDYYASMAGACRLLQSYPNEKLQKQISGYVDHIFAASETVESGYFSIYNLLMTNGKVFGEADNPGAAADLFNLGYLIEFGIAWYDATGDGRMLRVALRYLNFTVRYSKKGSVNFVSWHTGVEYNILALCEYLKNHPDVVNNSYLSDVPVNREDYLSLAGSLLSYRGEYDGRVGGKQYGSYANDHIPYEELRTAAGHSVVALLYFFALSEMGRATDDTSYMSAAYRIWEDVTGKQMYVTGSVGSVYAYEGFGGDYYLPNYSYSESCTSGALVQFSDSLSLQYADGKYQNVVENCLYNTLLGSIGANGNTFFYTNPLETATSSRWSWHGVPCCTKYGLLIYGNLPRYLYAYEGNTVYADQYIGSTATLRLASGNLVIRQEADWAGNGKAFFTLQSGAAGLETFAFRLPDWSDNTVIKVNGTAVTPKVQNGYAYLTQSFKDGDEITVEADASVKRIYADPNVESNHGLVALQSGPFLYCAEGVDNTQEGINGDVTAYTVLSPDASFTASEIRNLYGGVRALSAPVKLMLSEKESRDITVTLIPFFARSNRGASSVRVWLHEDMASVTEYPFRNDHGTELKALGAGYTAATNAIDPKGSGSRNIAVIADGVVSYGKDSEQYDTFGATMIDDLGKKGYIWFGIRFQKEYTVTSTVFWEGGHWGDGGWFGASPTVQVYKDKKWVDVPFTLTPSYPEDAQNAQMPTNEAYAFILEEPIVCSGVRVVGKTNRFAGHASCAEIEVYGGKKEDIDILTTGNQTETSPFESDEGETSEAAIPAPKKKNAGTGLALGIAGAIIALGVSGALFFTGDGKHGKKPHQ